jgi:hypothetical protein
VSTVGWVLGVAALLLLAVGLVGYRVGRPSDDRQAAAIVSLILGADLLVLAVGSSLV